MVSGMDLDLLDIPAQTKFPNEIKMSKKETEAAADHIQQLLVKGAIEECPYPGSGFVSNIFLRPKPDGLYRMILNLKKFNKFVEYAHFKMESLNHILDLVLPFSFMCVLDLTDAYLTIPVGKFFVKFLFFRFQGKFFCYICMPFGLSFMPRKFTKLLKPIITFLHKNGVTLVIYIDDLWITALTYSACLQSMFTTARLLTSLGFLLNKKKSHPVPSRRVVALGYVIDSISMTISLPDHKMDDVLHHCSQLLSTTKPTIHYVAQVLGKIKSCFPVLPLGRAH